MTQLKVNYVVFAATVACITIHSLRQLNGSNTNKITTVEARTTSKDANKEASLLQDAASSPAKNR